MKAHLLFLFAAGSLLMACSTEKKQSIAYEGPPNVILLMADDAGYGDLGCYGQEKFGTPNIDRLASEGMLFTSHYSGSTVCAPSRSSLMTGLHTGHTFIRGNKEVRPEGQYPIPSEFRLLPEYFKEAGYATGGFGKWGLGAPGSEGDPVNQGFDEWCGYNCQRLAHNFYPEYLWHNDDTVFLHENDNGKVGTYSHDLIHKKALEFIDRHQEVPFFLFLPYTIPHAELLVPDDSIFQDYLGKFPENPYKGVDEGPDYRKGPYGSQDNPHAAFAAMMTRMDMAVGDILAKIDSLGISQHTVFIFTSDNGPHLEGGADPDFFNSNGQFRGYKRDFYEGGIRVPMIVRWTGTVKPGTSTDHLSAFWDILPTCCEMAGMDQPQETDGISFLPVLIGQEERQKLHNFLYWEFYEQGGKQAVRAGEWKGVRLGVKDDRNAPLELYNLEKDPGETENIADQHPEIRSRLDSMMKKAHQPSEVFTW
ncbi:MAG: arylsulfatase [Cyclobacteriaceae bacterium]|nr:arylsulfatase [Cyclobacteriaceae bacterium]